tara:strand:+ start:225 stop:1343 length:1119 start_codon:yes stop_codon:yes gene_type:complete
MNLVSKFRKKGLVHIKNFFSDEEIKIINNTAIERLEQKFDFVYLINNDKIKSSFLNNKKFNDLKQETLKLCGDKDFKIKSLENFIETFIPLIKIEPQQYYLEKLHALFIENHQSNTDMLFDRTYSEIFLNNKILDIYRELLQTDKITYYGESHVDHNKPFKKGLNKTTSRSWHTDDWPNHLKNTSESTYNLRGAIFYNSNSNYSGGTKFLPGSHYYIKPTKLLKKLVKKFLFKKDMENSILNTRVMIPKNIFPSSKDFILWDKRLFHSAWAVKIKKFPKLVLSPSLEDFLTLNDNYKFLIEKNSFPRSLANLDFGKQCKSLDKYLECYGSRPDYKSYWKDKKILINNEFIYKLNNKNISFSDKAIKFSEMNN